MTAASFSEAARDETLLSAALAEANIGTLLLSLVALGGDAALLDEAAPHISGPWPWMQQIPDELAGRIRQAMLTLLKQRAAQGDSLPPPADSQTLSAMMGKGVGAAIPDEYMELIVEETAMGTSDVRALQWHHKPPAERRLAFKVVIVGAGFSGMVAGIRLKQAGIPFVILEKNAGAAGTWYENDYPGCAVDTVSHFYSLSFRPNNNWSHYFAKRDEIYQYLEETVDAYDLREHIRFGVEVSDLSYEADTRRWRVRMAGADGLEQTLHAQAVISAVGLINRPSIPDIAGLDTFAGPKLHSAAWDHSVDLAGRLVALIGTGASGMQIGPAIAAQTAKLTVFQRSPHWVAFNPLYHQAVSPGQRWALEHIPGYSQWQRFLFFWGSSDGLHASLHVDPSWDKPAQSLNATNHQTRMTLEAHIRKELDGRDDLIAKCIPDYPPYGKRMLRDNHWFKMLRQENVELVTDAIERITPNGVVTADGLEHAADAIVFATGFNAGRMLWPMTVHGRDGQSIRELWGDDDPRAYKGITVPGFPNLFLTSGPNTGLAHGGSHFFHSECQVRYITEAIREMIENDWDSLEVRRDAHDAFNAEVDARCSKMVWAHPGVKSWYKNDRGRVTVVSPWRLLEYWQMTREFDADQYQHTTRSAAKTR